VPRQHITEPDKPGPAEGIRGRNQEPTDPEADSEGHGAAGTDKPGPEEAVKRGSPQPADPEDDAEGHVRGRGIEPADDETKPGPDDGVKWR
jgi:hypothetical protein